MIATSQIAMKHILITGASSGIGLEAALQLHSAGHQLTLPCRNSETAAELNQRIGGSAEMVQTPICDLADLTSVASCAKELLIKRNPIDTLVLNAGLQYSGIIALNCGVNEIIVRRRKRCILCGAGNLQALQCCIVWISQCAQFEYASTCS